MKGQRTKVKASEVWGLDLLLPENTVIFSNALVHMKGKMGRSGCSSSASDPFTGLFKSRLLFMVCLIRCWVFNLADSRVFDSGILAASSRFYGNVSSSSKIGILNIDDFGAKGDGTTDDTKSLQDVWELACSLSVRTKIMIPAENSYLVRPMNFSGPCRSKVTLQISGVIVAPQNPEIWDGLDVRKWLYFHGVDNLSLQGGGKIDGMGQEWWARSCKTNASNPCTHAPTAITFHKCDNLRIRNITLFNSQQMHMVFTHCVKVKVSAVQVIAPADSPNTDGIHISASTRVELDGVFISTGDDCVSIVSNSSVIKVKNIFCGPGHGISIGSLGKYKSYSGVHNIVVDGASFINTENGVRIKTWQGGKGFARKIAFQNVQMFNVSNPIIIDQYYCDSSEPCFNQSSAVKIDRVSFRGIKGTSATQEAIILSCSDDHPCTNISLEDIQLEWVSGDAKSFCWEAYGTSSGLVSPDPCLSSGPTAPFLVKSYSIRQWLYDYAFF